jgi:hypothetical protein
MKPDQKPGVFQSKSEVAKIFCMLLIGFVVFVIICLTCF